ncbi:dual specificity phosphatase, catalytic domain protein [Dictyocaulus viviparus]|uniref:Dual specificity phosphatase, catalytic domain protein n=1 Tax=Dictyocaulus viviparus TaxID=29172 RepID=A0A0D8XU21_DICVI|nr:dual specificity phosphatase, catalytic domain protein [Dictyocaulus viviparus]
MVRVCRVVPKEWTRYSPIGTVIPRTRFIVFKTPLNDRLLTKVDRTQRFTVWKLMWMLAERGLRLGMVVDLTDTDRYYDKDEIEGMCIQYRKINCPGRGFVERTECVSEFNKAIQDYIDKSDDEEALIGVHCTNGVNRSGYLICRFLIERLGWSSHEALDGLFSSVDWDTDLFMPPYLTVTFSFERARGYPIEKGSYVQALHKAAIESRNRKDVSDSDSEGHRRKSKKSKKKRERDEMASFTDSASQMGTIMQQFFAQLQGAHQAAESGNGSGYDGSPAQSGSYASPGQQHWAYQPKTQARNASFSNSPLEQGVQDEEIDEGEDYEAGEEVEIGIEQPFVKSTAQKRRDRRLRMKNMLSVMKRGRFHEIQEMQREFVARSGTQ